MSEPVFGEVFNPEGNDETGAPHVCTKCGGINTVHMFLNTETDELTLECEECGEEYDADQACGLLGALGAIIEEEDKAWGV